MELELESNRTNLAEIEIEIELELTLAGIAGLVYRYTDIAHIGKTDIYWYRKSFLLIHIG